MRTIPSGRAIRGNRPVATCAGFRARAGLTLLELTVVILVLLTLLTVLYIGARGWKRGSDRMFCILNMQKVQKGVRGYSNIFGYNPGTSVTDLRTKVIGPGCFVESEPSCPGSGAYDFAGNQIPSIGTIYMTCSLAVSGKHQPDEYSEW